MDEICRLCLSVSPETRHNLFEDSEIIEKISSCLRLEILHDKDLPKQICQTCMETIDQIHTFHAKVSENQNILYMKQEEDSLEKFYRILKENKKESVEEKENDLYKIEEEIVYVSVKEIDIAMKEEDIGFTDPFDYSSDDNWTPTIKQKKGKVTKNKNKTNSSPKKNKIHKTKENIEPKDPFEAEDGENIQEDNLDCSKNNAQDTIDDNIVTDNVTQTIETVDANIKSENPQKDSIPVTVSQFKCLTCFKLLKCHTTLSRHYKTKHRPTNIHYDLDDYAVIECNGKTTFKCGKCDRCYINKKKVRQHLQSAHAETRPYSCNLCGRTYKTITEIIRHDRSHNDNRFFCSYKCGYSTPYLHIHKAHEKRHRNEFKYKCEECGKGFDVKTWYEEHLNLHTGAKPFACDLCGKAYPFRKYLVRHRSTAHLESIERPPTDSTKLFCVLCSHPCCNKNDLNDHLAKEHGQKSLLVCDICGKTFSRTYHLNAHRDFTHLGIKPHTCTTCGKSFKTSSHLKRHESVHSGARPFVCECGKRYAREATLRHHTTRDHAAVSPKCVKCDATFATLQKLASHEKSCRF